MKKNKDTSLVVAKNFNRLISYVMDWYLASLLAGIPIALIYAVQNNTTTISQDLSQIPTPFSFLAGILAVLGYLTYYILLPLVCWEGQTLGKKIMGIAIIPINGEPLAFSHLWKREVLGVCLIEGGIAASSSYLHQLIQLIFPQIPSAFFFVFSIITFISITMGAYFPQKRMIHDYIGGTQVISTFNK